MLPNLTEVGVLLVKGQDKIKYGGILTEWKEFRSAPGNGMEPAVGPVFAKTIRCSVQNNFIIYNFLTSEDISPLN